MERLLLKSFGPFFSIRIILDPQEQPYQEYDYHKGAQTDQEDDHKFLVFPEYQVKDGAKGANPQDAQDELSDPFPHFFKAALLQFTAIGHASQSDRDICWLYLQKNHSLPVERSLWK